MNASSGSSFMSRRAAPALRGLAATPSQRASGRDGDVSENIAPRLRAHEPVRRVRPRRGSRRGELSAPARPRTLPRPAHSCRSSCAAAGQEVAGLHVAIAKRRRSGAGTRRRQRRHPNAFVSPDDPPTVTSSRTKRVLYRTAARGPNFLISVDDVL